MNEDKAREILEDYIEDEGLASLPDARISWDYADDEVFLDGYFTAEKLEAVAWWMRNKYKEPSKMYIPVSGRNAF